MSNSFFSWFSSRGNTPTPAANNQGFQQQEIIATSLKDSGRDVQHNGTDSNAAVPDISGRSANHPSIAAPLADTAMQHDVTDASVVDTPLYLWHTLMPDHNGSDKVAVTMKRHDTKCPICQTETNDYANDTTSMVQRLERLWQHLRSSHDCFLAVAVKEDNLYHFATRPWRSHEREYGTVRSPPPVKLPRTTTSDHLPRHQYVHLQSFQTISDGEYLLDLDSDDEVELDGGWRQEQQEALLDEFTDVDPAEKKFHKLWNAYMERHRRHYGPVTEKQLPSFCFQFVQVHATDLQKHQLQVPLLWHLVTMYDCGHIGRDDMGVIAASFQNLCLAVPSEH